MQTWRTLSTRLDTANRGQRLRFGVFFSFLFFSFFFLLRRAFHVGLCFSSGSRGLDTANKGERLRFGVFFFRRAFHMGLCFSSGSHALFTGPTSTLFQKKKLKLSPIILFT